MVAVPQVPKAPKQPGYCCKPSKPRRGGTPSVKRPGPTRLAGAKKVNPKTVHPKKSSLGTPCRCPRPRRQ